MSRGKFDFRNDYLSRIQTGERMEALLISLVGGNAIPINEAEDLMLSISAHQRDLSLVEAEAIAQSLGKGRNGREVLLGTRPDHIQIVLDHIKTNHPDIWSDLKRLTANPVGPREDLLAWSPVSDRLTKALREIPFLGDRPNPFAAYTRDGVRQALIGIAEEELAPEEAPLLRAASEYLTSDKIEIVVDFLRSHHPDLWEQEKRLASLPPPQGIHSNFPAFRIALNFALYEVPFLQNLTIEEFRWAQVAILRAMRRLASADLSGVVC